MKGVRSVSRFSFLHVDVQLFQQHLLKRQYLLHCIAFTPLSKISDYIYGGLFLGSLFCSIDLSVLLPLPHCLDYCIFMVSLEVSQDFKCQSSKFVLQYCVDYSGSFAPPYKL